MNFPAMKAILYPIAVEKKRISRILCGISAIGTIKGHKNGVFMHLRVKTAVPTGFYVASWRTDPGD